MEKKPEQQTDKDDALSDDQLDLVVGGVGTAVPSATVGRESSIKVGRSIGREQESKATGILDIKINQP